MFTPKDAFSSFSVDDLEKARLFYGQTLGLDVSDGGMGTLQVKLPSGARVMIQGNHAGQRPRDRLVQGPGGQRSLRD